MDQWQWCSLKWGWSCFIQSFVPEVWKKMGFLSSDSSHFVQRANIEADNFELVEVSKYFWNFPD